MGESQQEPIAEPTLHQLPGWKITRWNGSRLLLTYRGKYNYTSSS